MLNVMSTAGASILAIGYVIPMIYMLWSLRYGRIAGPNPWGAVGLEWQTSSPPPTENFVRTPCRNRGDVSLLGRGENHCLAQRLSLINSTASNSSAMPPLSACGYSS